MTSIWQAIIALPFAVFVIGLLPLVASGFGFAICAMVLCEGCQQTVLESSIRLVRFGPPERQCAHIPTCALLCTKVRRKE